MLFILSRAKASLAHDYSRKAFSTVNLILLICLASITLLLASCSTVSSAQSPSKNQSAPQNGSIQITPANAQVQSAGSLQLSATLTGTSQTAVVWRTNIGTVSSSGLFKAPAVTTATQATVTVVPASTPQDLVGADFQPNSGSSGQASPTVATATLTILPPGSSSSVAITSTYLPTGTVDVGYSANLSATGGDEPYKWSALAGSLPKGLTLDSATGAINGTPLQPGKYSVQLQVTDAMAHAATSTSTLAVSSSSRGGGNFDGPAELPRVYMQTTMSDTPANGVVTTVPSGGDLQTALNNAQCGDVIELQAGATFSGLFKVPAKPCDSQHWIIVRTSTAEASLPAENERMTPCYAGVSSLPGRPPLNCRSTHNVLAKILYDQSAGSGPIQFESGANHYRFVGLEITRQAGSSIGALVMTETGVTADEIVVDRTWLHGTATDETNTAVDLVGLTNTAVINSYMSDFHCTSKIGACVDSHAIAGGCGTAPGGPYQITNNFIEASGEGILFGGCSATTTPADIQITQNHFFKPLTWMEGRAGFVGGKGGNPFVVKNHMELKNAQRVLAEDNIFENNWGGFTQYGHSILMTPKNQYSGNANVCPTCQVTDVTVRYSTISHVGAGISISNVLSDGKGQAASGERYSIHDVVIDDISSSKYAGGGGFMEYGNGWKANVLNSVTVNHVTAFPEQTSHLLLLWNDTTNPTMWGFTFTNNIVNGTNSPVYNGDGHPLNCAFHNVPITSLSTCFRTFSFTSNVMPALLSTYPPSSWPSGNFFPASDAAIQFVFFNNGSGGDYHLSNSSPYKNAGSDGKDPGADIDLVNAGIAGVY